MIELTAWFETQESPATVQRRLRDHLGLRRDKTTRNRYVGRFMMMEMVVGGLQKGVYSLTCTTDYDTAYYGWVRDVQSINFLGACQTITWALKTRKMLCQDPYLGLIAYKVNKSFRRNMKDKAAQRAYQNPISNRLLYRRADAIYDDYGNFMGPDWKGPWMPVKHWGATPLPSEAAKVKKVAR